jgi:hypothetical protein
VFILIPSAESGGGFGAGDVDEGVDQFGSTPSRLGIGSGVDGVVGIVYDGVLENCAHTVPLHNHKKQAHKHQTQNKRERKTFFIK